MAQDRKSFLLRLDPALHVSLQRWADEELRSLNGQIEYLLRQAVTKRGVKLPKEDAGNEAREKRD
jgi:hypothetical protein